MDQVEKVARALCMAEGALPDQRVQTGGVEAGHIGEGAVAMVPSHAPRWTLFKKEAIKFVAAYNALSAGGDGSFVSD